MWNGVSQRVRALIAAKEREYARLHLPIHASRADIQIKFSEDGENLKPISGRALLVDFKPKGLYFYSKERLPPNLEVFFEMQHPEVFKLVGKIIFCQYQPSSARILTENSFPYRVGMGFHFQNEEEEKAFKEFCERSETSYVSPRELFIKKPEILTLVENAKNELKTHSDDQSTLEKTTSENSISENNTPENNVTPIKSAA